MRIDIDQLDEAELRDLNHRIVERLRFLQQMRAHTAMLKLSIGDRVSFRGHDGEEVQGRVEFCRNKDAGRRMAEKWSGFLRRPGNRIARPASDFYGLPSSGLS